tara:strand:- start:489 stop:770 length:282 start_codon:yes stop_codon:yes gene_type:complete
MQLSIYRANYKNYDLETVEGRESELNSANKELNRVQKDLEFLLKKYIEEFKNDRVDQNFALLSQKSYLKYLKTAKKKLNLSRVWKYRKSNESS